MPILLPGRTASSPSLQWLPPTHGLSHNSKVTSSERPSLTTQSLAPFPSVPHYWITLPYCLYGISYRLTTLTGLFLITLNTSSKGKEPSYKCSCGCPAGNGCPAVLVQRASSALGVRSWGWRQSLALSNPGPVVTDSLLLPTPPTQSPLGQTPLHISCAAIFRGAINSQRTRNTCHVCPHSPREQEKCPSTTKGPHRPATNAPSSICFLPSPGPVPLRPLRAHLAPLLGLPPCVHTAANSLPNLFPRPVGIRGMPFPGHNHSLAGPQELG